MDGYSQNNEYSFARPYFSADEYELWRGKSNGMDSHQKIIMIPFAVFFLGFALFWTATATSAAGIMGLFGLPFIAVGAYMLFGKNIIGNKTYYVVTNRKIYRSQAGRVDMVDLANLPPMRVVGHSNGRGSIYFGEYQYRSHGKNHYGMVFSVDNVDNIAELQRIIGEALRN